MKLAPNLGVGLGFFPPDTGALAQWGDREGTVDTPLGKRPSPARWFGAHRNVSYFSALGAIGWRPARWLALGAGFQWQLVAYSLTSFSRADHTRTTSSDIKTQVFARDLFVPGFVLSAQLAPLDNLDIAIGYKWSDRLASRAKLDITTGDFGAGTPFPYVDDEGVMQSAGARVPTTTNNRVGSVHAPPIWVPQLSFGVRYADRLMPRVPLELREAEQRTVGRHVEDPMSTERWDIEANAIMYFNGANDVASFINNGQQALSNAVSGSGAPIAPVAGYVGQCVGGQVVADCQRETPVYFHGKTQLSLRLGGDYNILPGLLSVRIGLSYESNGQDPSYLDPENYMLGRIGLHAGLTLRVAEKTDISLGYVHFIQEDVALTVNPASPLPSVDSKDPVKYHVVTGKADGVAKFAISDAADAVEGTAIRERWLLLLSARRRIGRVGTTLLMLAHPIRRPTRGAADCASLGGSFVMRCLIWVESCYTVILFVALLSILEAPVHAVARPLFEGRDHSRLVIRRMDTQRWDAASQRGASARQGSELDCIRRPVATASAGTRSCAARRVHDVG
jgi:hypothetical protein